MAVRVWAAIARRIAEKVRADASVLASACIEGESEYWWDTRIDEACAKLESALGAVDDALGGFPTADLLAHLKGGLRLLMGRGVSTLQSNIRTGSTPDEAYNLVLSQLVRDAIIMFVDMVKAIVSAVVMPAFIDAVKLQVIELAEPVENMIPDAFKSYLSLGVVIDSCLDSAVGAAIESAIEEPIAPEKKQLEALEVELKKQQGQGEEEGGEGAAGAEGA